MRHRRVVFSVFLTFVAVEACVVLWRPAGLASAHPYVQRFIAQADEQSGGVISQSFEMGANGLSGVSVYPVAPDFLGGGNVALELWETAEGNPERPRQEWIVRRQEIGVFVFLRDERFTWNFDPIDHSARRRYRLLVRVPSGVGLAAARSKRNVVGLLFAGDRAVWGTLVFDTIATRATVARRVHHGLRRHVTWPANLIALTAVVFVGHGAFLGLLLAVSGGKPR